MAFLSMKLTRQSEAAKAKYIIPFNYCWMAIGAYFSLTYYLRYEAKILAMCCLFATVSGMLLPLFMRAIKSYTIVANYIILVLFLTVLALSLYTGGIKASSIWWIGLIPVIAALLLNGFYSVIWFVISIIEVVLLFYMKNNDLLPTNVIPPGGMDQFLITSTVFGIFLITILCILTDTLRERISNEKEELQNKSFRLTQLASLGSLASGVSHEINNPLAVIKGSQLKIKRMIESEEVIDKKNLINYMNKIERNVKRIQEITTSLRGISKDGNKKIVAINMQELLTSVAAMGRERIGIKPITLNLEFKATELYFNGIYSEVFQAFYNIVENSIDELVDLNNGAGKIEISLDFSDDNMVICFKDNGRGIPEKFRDNIFDPFFTTKRFGHATGLGLTYSFNVISYNGGTLELVAQKEKGTTFKATLPVFQA